MLNLHFTELAVFLQAKIERRFAREPAARSQLPRLVIKQTRLNSLFELLDY